MKVLNSTNRQKFHWAHIVKCHIIVLRQQYGGEFMEILLASLLLLWGDVSANNPDVTFEQMVQASLDSKQAIVQGPPVEEKADSTEGEVWVKKDPQLGEAPIVKGVYASAYTAGGSSKFEPLLQLIDETELNALVIDVKEDKGYITYKTANPELTKYETSQNIIADVPGLMATLHEREIYPIARVVIFKDTILANKRPDLSFLNPDGSVWHNAKSNPEAFLNPYKKEVWEYNIEIAKEAALMGFKEIQFDYVRFPEGFETRADILTYDKDERSRAQVITDFTEYARQELNPLGVRVSVDIFGYAASVKTAEGIGQDFNGISKYVDVICPMVYPSHYSTGWFDAVVPDAEPYKTINGAMIDTHKKLEEIGEYKPVIRPWIQDFSAPWIKGSIKYGKKEVEDQIRGLKDNGIEEFLLWNSSNVYTGNVNYDLE
jgi:hypothetical protein